MIRAFKEEDTETVIRIWLAASVRSHSFIDKAYWEEKAESMRTLYLPLSEIVVDEDRATGEVVAFMAFVEDYLAATDGARADYKAALSRKFQKNWIVMHKASDRVVTENIFVTYELPSITRPRPFVHR